MTQDTSKCDKDIDRLWLGFEFHPMTALVVQISHVRYVLVMVSDRLKSSKVWMFPSQNRLMLGKCDELGDQATYSTTVQPQVTPVHTVESQSAGRGRFSLQVIDLKGSGRKFPKT